MGKSAPTKTAAKATKKMPAKAATKSAAPRKKTDAKATAKSASGKSKALGLNK